MLAETNQPREAISRLDKARRLGAPVQEVEHGRGDLLVFAGQYDEARQAYDAALAERPDWSMVRGDRAVAEACLGRMGPLMEALPAALAEAGAQAPAAMCEFLLALGERCLQRGEANLSTGLFRTALVLEGWRAAEEGRERIGVFLRAALDAVPAEMPRLISLLREHVHDEDALQLLDPYCQAVDLVQTRDLSILEQLFPEVRELVCEIAFKIDPALEGTLPVK